ncbi:HEPN domain-containing protein [Cylindrospermum sp. FACHB-282]|uniref:ApeA N-terminal domain 1-containing protein n=1 Tax=Cylindrospermum sp. FACHB-282 TaxID=2692794 RepID=UPI001689B630|nr:HEPN domain-containing protein [Cylindrospermum sp. FACHB-282]MBD2384481.1 hypothetical protein [Cylindrospermum sp. FACHB-282]
MKEKKVAFTSFEVEGKWFLPENPNYTVEGTLKFSAYEHPILELKDDLINQVPANSLEESLNRDFSRSSVPIILGELYNGETIGEKITLYKCVVNAKGFSTGLQTIKCYPAYILRGFHFYKQEELKFNNLCFHFTNLETWLSINNIEIELIPDKNKTRFEELQVNYRPLPFIPLCNIDNFTLGIKDRPISSIGLHLASEFKQHIGYIPVSEDKLFELNSFEFQELDKYLETIFKVQDFLVFAMGQSTNLTEVTTIIKTKCQDFEFVNDEDSCESQVVVEKPYLRISHLPNAKIIEKEIEKEFSVKIYFKQLKSDLSGEFKYDNVLLDFHDIENNFNNVFIKWYSNFERLETSLNLYLGLFYIPNRYVRERFLSLAQSIEAFHRIVYGGKFMEEDDYVNGLYKDFLKVIDSRNDMESDFKSSIKKTLSHLYQFSLRKRLKELIRTHQTCLPECFRGKEQRNNFADMITNC